MTYLTTVEVAELKGCSLQYVQKCIKEGKIEASVRENAANNRTEYRVPLTALTEKQQIKWEEQQRRKLGLEPSVKASLKKAEKDFNDDFNSRQITLSDLSYEQRDEIAFWSGIIQDWLAERERNGAKYGKCKVDEMDNYRNLIEKFGGDRIYIPKAKSLIPTAELAYEIRCRRQNGDRNEQIAHDLEIPFADVRKIK